MKKKDRIFEEVREILKEGLREISQTKQVAIDKRNKQASIKIPKSLALKAKLDEESEFRIVFNPFEEKTKQQIAKSKLVIYLEDGKKD